MATQINTPEQWIIFGKVGTSSKTIWAVLTGVVTEYVNSWEFDVPHDPDDFSRCYALLCHFPEWKPRLAEVANIFPKWRPFVREWEKLTEMYHEYSISLALADEEKPKHPILAKRHRHIAWEKIYSFMRNLEDEGLVLDGWVQTGPGSWRKEK